jgi:hypothetical protein
VGQGMVANRPLEAEVCRHITVFAVTEQYANLLQENFNTQTASALLRDNSVVNYIQKDYILVCDAV